MEVILLLLFVIWLIFGPIIALLKAASARRDAEAAKELVEMLQDRVRDLEIQLRKSGQPAQAVIPEKRVVAEIPEKPAPVPAPAPASEPAPAPPPLPIPVIYPEPEEVVEAKEPFSWERFMGVKLFAWLGGVAMFFGVIFFVKYAFENNPIPPHVRVILGYVAGAALLGGGLWTHRLPRYRVLAQAFCATGVLILYGVSFAAHAIYRFPAFGILQTFVVMALVTALAFVIAVRLNALVVGVLGMLGGFMTPVLLATREDPVAGLFGYIALLDIGLIAVSRHGRWRLLTPAAAVGTAVIYALWHGRFFHSGNYAEGLATLIPMGILLGFPALFLAGGWLGRKRPGKHAMIACIALAAVAVMFSFVMLESKPVSARPFLLYGFLLLAQLLIAASCYLRPRFAPVQLFAAAASFLHLALWTAAYLEPGNLRGILVLHLIFGTLHAGLPVAMARYGKASPSANFVAPWFMPLVLLMMLAPVFQLSPVPLVLWVAVLAANLLVIALAAVTRGVLPVLAALVLTMVVAATWLVKAPAADPPLLPFLGIIAGFAILFTAAGQWFSGRAEESQDRVAAAFLPVSAGLLTYALLVLALLHVQIVNPAPLFGVALLMSAILVALAIGGKMGPLVLATLVGTLVVEGVWHVSYFSADAPWQALTWYLVFYLAFLALPFVFHRRLADQPAAWIAGALSGVGHFLLVHDAIGRGFPNDVMGLVPAAFAAPALLAVFALLRTFPEMDKPQQSRVAWFGGVALLFITLIFPIQFERQWITVSWAIEGALLLWLFRRVPHPGLQFTGLALLAISFIRLTLNPAVFFEYPRGGTAIFNWHLYTYGIVAAAQFIGAKWLTDPDARLVKLHPRGLLATFGGVLLFLLLNIEIADYFTAPGEKFIAFRFGGNFARDMTYSIGWGLFALALLGIGFRGGSKHARFAAVGLLVVTLLKVFLHDLAAIENIYRIGALVGVAVIAFIASFLYQRFFERTKP